MYQLGAFHDETVVLDVVGHGTDAGTTVQVLKNAHEAGQQFAIEYRGDGCYTVRDIHSNRYLDVYGGGCTNDTRLAMYGSEDTGINANRLFRILPNTDGTYSLVCNVSNQYVDLDCGSTADGTKVHTWQTTLSGDSQKWRLLTETVIAPGEYVIAAGGDPDFVLGLESNNVVLAAADGTAGQKYRLRIEDGSYTIQNTASGKLLNVSGNGTADGTNLIQYTAGDTASGDNERWNIVPHFDGTVSLVSRSGGLYITLTDNSLTAGANICLWSSATGGSAGQRWRLLDHSHVYELQNAVEATCTQPGYTGDLICKTCGDVARTGETIPASGHIWDDGVVTTPPTPAAEGVKTFTCTVCGEERTEAIAMLPLPELVISHASLSLESDLAINFYVPDSALEGWEAPYMIFSKNIYDVDGNVIHTVHVTVTEYRSARTPQGEAMHVYSLTGITAMEMTTQVTATLYASHNGEEGSSNTVSYSILDYVTNQLAANPSRQFADVLVDLVKYGEAAQQYWGYNLANLATKNLTEKEKTWGCAGTPELSSAYEVLPAPDASVLFSFVSLSLRKNIEMNYYLDLTSYSGPVEELKLVVTYGSEQAVIDGSDFVSRSLNGKTYSVASFAALNYAELRTPCTARVYSKSTGACLSSTVVYSVESYACSMGDGDRLKPLLEAMMKLGDSAIAYFG